MSKQAKNKKGSNSTEIVPNKPSPANPKLVTMTDYYQHTYQTEFNKLDKESQEAIKTNSSKPLQIVHGEKREFANVRQFVKLVIEKAEEAYDKAQSKKDIQAK